MKKILLFILFVVIIVFIYQKYNKQEQEIFNEENIEERGVFISYIDYSPLLKGKSEEEQKQAIDLMVNNISNFDLNMIILQVRPFSDAIYESSIYLSSKTIVKNEGDELELDILDYFIKKAHEQNISVHAWINPYRIRSTNNISDINKNNFYYDYFGTDIIEISNNGIYFNPSSEEALKYILDGVKEIVKNYDVDGIIYDDYFYPSKTIDLARYQNYSDEMTIEEYRINNINTLIKETYKVIKEENNKVLFGISPAGNINHNINEEYLDIPFILEQTNYIDYIMPQIYYGFENQNLPFFKTIYLWTDLIKNDDIKLYIALALYKSGLEDIYAGSGQNEWIYNNDIIKKQILISRNSKNYTGFSIFRYSHLFTDNKSEVLKQEIDNLLSIF